MRSLVTRSCSVRSTTAIVSFTSGAGSESTTRSWREMIIPASSFGGLNRSAKRRKNLRLRRGTVTVSCTTTREATVSAARTTTLSPRAALSAGPISSRIFLSSRLDVAAERIVRRRLIVRRSLSAKRRTMLSRRIVCSESSAAVSPRSESIRPRTVRSSRL